jgi:agmatine/peptidylarginine deiminase
MKWNVKLLYITTLTILLTASFSLVTAETNIFTGSKITIESQFLNAPPEPIRQPAEFEPMEGVLIRYPFGISYQIIAEMSEDVEVITIVSSQSQANYVESLYEANGVDTDNTSYLIALSDSHWTRDYGPWFIFSGNNELEVIDFTYNRPRPNDNNIPSAFANDQDLTYYKMPLTHAGGNYMTDGQGISVSTSLVWSENTGYSHQEIDEIVEEYLGVTKYHVVQDALGEYIKHIDCWAKLLAPDKIMIIKVSSSHSNYDEIEEAVRYFENQTSCYGTPFKVERVYTHLQEPYINCLILNTKVLIPTTGSMWDDDAIQAYENAMPGYEVLGFSGSWYNTDALHCRTKGIPDRFMLYIEHTPLFGFQNGDDGIEIQAKIVPHSEENLIINSTCVYWRENKGNWDSVQMTSIEENYYQAIIYPKENGAIVDYYIHAEDNSNRSENHPYIGAPGAHSFIVNISQINNPPDKPEKPSGLTNGKTGSILTYSTMTTDPENDQIFFKWDWGDGTFSKWLGPYDSGQPANVSHSWDKKGTYLIRAKAKDTKNDESEWSDPLELTIPKNKAFTINSNFLHLIRERISHTFSILYHYLFL